MGITKV